MMSDPTNTPTDTAKEVGNSGMNLDGGRRHMEVNEWTTRWEDGQIGFHNSEYHKKLVRFLDTLIYGRKDLKFFFPLCGKALDMKWMYDLGHTVVGVEASPKACEEFFLDNDLTYLAEAVEKIDGYLYKTEDNRIRIYCCDFYKFSPDVEKDVTAVFDRASLVAINKADRKRYADLILSLCHPDCRYLLCTFEYDGSRYPGPPHSLSLEEIKELYDCKCNVELLAVDDEFEERHKKWGIDKLDERVHLLTFKR